MRVQLIALVMVFLIVPAISQYTQVGGSYGTDWLNQFGNKHEVKEAKGLWNWGAIPKGHTYSGGKLTEDSGGLLIYPAFPSSAAPIVLNATVPGRGLNATNQSMLNPYIYEDPWTVAQMSDRPVLFRVNPY